MELEDILKECQFFDDLVNIIPKEHYYIPDDTSDNEGSSRIPAYVKQHYKKQAENTAQTPSKNQNKKNQKNKRKDDKKQKNKSANTSLSLDNKNNKITPNKPGNKKAFDEKMKQLAIKRKSIPTPPAEKNKKPKIKVSPLINPIKSPNLLPTPRIDEVIDHTQFSKFSLDDAPSDTYLYKPKKVNLRKLIDEAEKKQNHMKKLSQTEEGKKVIENIEFEKAIARASGEKIKDDPKLLKKTLKRKENKKKKSSKEWNRRYQQQQQQQQKGKNNNNKEKTNDDRTDDKEKRGEKRKRAGFEGKNKPNQKNNFKKQKK